MNESNDTAFAGGTAGASTFDPIYDSYKEAPLQEAQDQEEALPRGYYLVECDSGKGGFTKEENIPQIRLVVTVLLGAAETVGRKAFGGLKFGVSKFEYQNNDQGVRVKVPMAKDPWIEAGRAQAVTLKRVAHVLGLLQELPSRPHTTESLTQYAAQFAGKKAVVFIGSLPGRDDFGPSNFFDWDTIRTPEEQVKDKTGAIVAATATEFVQKKIAMAAARAAKKSGATVAPAAAATPAASAGDFS